MRKFKILITSIWILASIAWFTMCCASVMANDQVLTEEERIVALTILGEARGEGEEGMYAVACVIQRRSHDLKLSPRKVCLQPKQFDTWNGVKRERELWFLWESKSRAYAREIARRVCNKEKALADTTKGATHFCTIKSNPYWAEGRKPTVIIGNHKFYKLK